MEKLLAMSILSSTPAEISGSSWMNLTMILRKKSCNNKEEEEAAAEKKISCNYKKGATAADCCEGEEKSSHREKKAPARSCYAPEFDGLNCFETIVSR